MKSSNKNFRANKIKRLMVAESQSKIYVDNVAFTNNHVRYDFFIFLDKLNWKCIIKSFC